MKSLALVIGFVLSLSICFSQTNNPTDTSTQYLIIKNDGTEYVGIMLSDDGREILLQTNNVGKIYLMKSDLKSIKKIEDAQLVRNGEFRGAGPFTTRYAFTTNALPIRKGENYTMLNLYGPEAHFAINNHFSLGAMTTWIASPWILAMKYSFRKKEAKVNFALGTLLGTSGYLNAFKTNGGLHWGSVTVGNRVNNLTFSAGYFYINSGLSYKLYQEGVFSSTKESPTVTKRNIPHGPMLSLGGIVRVGKKASVLIDAMFFSFKHEESKITTNVIKAPTFENGLIIPGEYTYSIQTLHSTRKVLAIMPGMRFQLKDNKAFQFCLAGVSLFGDWKTSFPLPLCSWFYQF